MLDLSEFPLPSCSGAWSSSIWTVAPPSSRRDTDAWYALADTSDPHHEEAKRFYTEQPDRTAFATTDLIVAETCALLSAHLSRDEAFAFNAHFLVYRFGPGRQRAFRRFPH